MINSNAYDSTRKPPHCFRRLWGFLYRCSCVLYQYNILTSTIYQTIHNLYLVKNSWNTRSLYPEKPLNTEQKKGFSLPILFTQNSLVSLHMDCMINSNAYDNTKTPTDCESFCTDIIMFYINRIDYLLLLINFLYNYKRASKSFFLSSKPGLPSNANIFCLYASTPGWLNGFTPNW